MIKLYKSDEVIYTASEVAEILNVCPQMVSFLCNKFKAPKLGRFFLINEQLLTEMKKPRSKGRPKKES